MLFVLFLPCVTGAAQLPFSHPVHDTTHTGAEGHGGSAESPGESAEPAAEAPQPGQAAADPVKAPALDISTLKSLSEVIAGVPSKRIIYVGESHDQFAHHGVQLEVIKAMRNSNGKVAIGMEMFQRPFQKALDDYISGRTEEREFLRSSEYFKRWGFDYSLYKPILDYARQEKIPVKALNIRREIVDKVSKSGLDSLTEEDKKQIPAEMDFSDNDYKERLKKIFEAHGGPQTRNFEYFYQSQILWDEIMAQSVDEFFREHHDYQDDGQMVVLAGIGHLMYGSGIPKRAYRRNGYDYAIVLNDGPVDRGVADYVIFPKQAAGSTPPKLMVMVKDESEGAIIAAFSEGSVSEKAGLKVGDRILSLDDIPVKTGDDVRIHLFYKKKGDTVRVKVVRRVFLLGDRVKEFVVTL